MMRKFFTMFTAILTCLCMTACSSGGGTNTEESEQVKTVEETKEEYTINTDICHAGTDSYYREGGTGVLYGWGFLPVDADSDKKPEDGIVVVANFLNRSDSPTEFQHFFWIKAFQSGVELDDMYVYSDIEFKPLDNWTKSVMGGATIQVAKAFELNDDSPVTVRLYEQLMPDNFVEIIIDPSKKEEDSSTDKKDDKKEDGKKEEKKSKTAQKIEKELTSYTFWELIDPTDEYYYSNFTFKNDGTGQLFEVEKYDFTWTITDKDTIKITYSDDGSEVEFTYEEDSDGSYIVNSGNGCHFSPVK